jgi:plasmid maintenance system killer protein
MDIRFASRKIQKLCDSENEMRARLGARGAARLSQRLAELKAATALEDLRHLPGARCHELTQDRKGQLAVDLVHPRRLIFEPAQDPVPVKEDGGLDWLRVTAVVIIGIVDYH